MQPVVSNPPQSSYPSAKASLELLKPITWFAPMWAFGCGIVSSGSPLSENLYPLFAGIALCGPMVCGTSQAANDWFDRHVDAINEPHRPIPSGRIPGHWGLIIANIWTVLSLMLAATLGVWRDTGWIGHCLGLFRTTVPPEGKWLVGQRRSWPVL
jgi:chlorophyll/bacteriochlorophyll a synthase